MFSFTEGGWQIYLLMPAMVALSTIWLKTSPIKHCSVAPIYSWRFSLKVLDDAQNGGKCLEGDAAIWEIVPDIVPTIVHDILPWLSPFDIVTSPYLLICHQPSIALNLTFLSSSQLQSIVNPLLSPLPLSSWPLSSHVLRCWAPMLPRILFRKSKRCWCQWYQGFFFRKSKQFQEIQNFSGNQKCYQGFSGLPAQADHPECVNDFLPGVALLLPLLPCGHDHHTDDSGDRDDDIANKCVSNLAFVMIFQGDTSWYFVTTFHGILFVWWRFNVFCGDISWYFKVILHGILWQRFMVFCFCDDVSKYFVMIFHGISRWQLMIHLTPRPLPPRCRNPRCSKPRQCTSPANFPLKFLFHSPKIRSVLRKTVLAPSKCHNNQLVCDQHAMSAWLSVMWGPLLWLDIWHSLRSPWKVRFFTINRRTSIAFQRC